MATIRGVRGMLLEEAMLYLLEWSGYSVVLDAPLEDETLRQGHSGIEVRGRGTDHQIDAIADFGIMQPFSNPQRLLLEAKCYAQGNTVGVEIMRNAVGVLHDVGEYWISRTGVPSKPRFHYQYAVFSTSDYTPDAEKYAYAHDIYLIQLAQNLYMQPIVDALRAITHDTFDAPKWNKIDINLTALRQIIRRQLRGWLNEYTLTSAEKEAFQRLLVDIMRGGELSSFVAACQSLDGGLLAMVDRRFPVFLAPAPGLSLPDLKSDYTVRIRRDHIGWSIRDTSNGDRLFTFDLPSKLLDLYIDGGQLNSTRMLDLKAERLSTMQAYTSERQGNQSVITRLVTLQLDAEWLSTLRSRASRR